MDKVASLFHRHSRPGEESGSTPSLSSTSPSLHASNHGNSDTGFEGDKLYELATPSEGREIDIDIVAIHGLMGNPYTTWTKGKDPAVTPWIMDFLPSQLPNARVFSYGYDSNFALIIANNRKDDIFLNSVKGIAFLGVPHHGSGVVQLGKYFAYLLRSFTRNTNADLLADLNTGSKVLNNICIDATHLICQMQIITFYETRKLPGLGMLIVDESSARLNSSNEEAIPINADHSSICKFASGDANCELIGGSIAALATRIIDIPSSTEAFMKPLAANQIPRLTIHAAMWADRDIKLALISKIKENQTLEIDTSYCVDVADPWFLVHKVICILYSYEGQALNLMVTHDGERVFSIYPGRVEPVSFFDPAVNRNCKSGSAGIGLEILAVIWGGMLRRHGPVDSAKMAEIYSKKRVECTNSFFGFDGYENEYKTCQVFYRMKDDLGRIQCKAEREHSTVVFD